MQVIATAGHVDHGKSALVRALTGMEPDRWEAERRRGLTIDLGYAWLTLPSGGRLAFVDVPGHERFVPNMLAGVGPVPAVLFVVAADGGWMPQSAEHLAAIDALGICHGLLAVTRADLADPGPVTRDAAARLARTSLGEVEQVAVSAVTGQGLPELLGALGRLAAGLPAADAGAPVRLWVDRAFSIKGSGTVVTGTLPGGTVRTGDELLVTPSLRRVVVRGIQSLKKRESEVSGVARVALNLRGVDPGSLARGTALVTPAAWTLAGVVDVRLALPGPPQRPPREVMLHVGAARTAARVRVLAGPVARLTLREALPLHVGDRVLLRVPGAASGGGEHGRAAEWPALAGAAVLDVAPPPLAGRGSAGAAGRELGSWPDLPGAGELLRRHGLLRLPALRAMGLAQSPAPVAGDWAADPAHWAALRERLASVVAEHAARDPLAAGMPVEAARAALGVPDRRLAEALAAPALTAHGGLLRPAGTSRAAGPAAGAHAGGPAAGALPEKLLLAVRTLLTDLASAPFGAPEAGRLRELGLEPRALAAAGRAGLLLRVSDQIVLAPRADAEAAKVLATLPQPFTTAQARQALGTTRRVAIPLLEYLDRAGITQRLPDDRRIVRRRDQP
ncbi:MAG TPA: selenocysteine-specific translation elongation factor [Streptosporangiaceae bacterium]|jgi:selenocysteine-specific elongation factor